MRIFIGNLGSEIETQDLYTLFSKIGQVRHANIPMDDYGIPHGYGYIVMNCSVEAAQAIKALNKKPFMGQFLNVSPALETASGKEIIPMYA